MDSLFADTLLVKIIEPHGWIFWMARFQSLLAVVISVAATIAIFRVGKSLEEASRKRRTATAWRALLEESGSALERMRSATEALNPTEPDTGRFEVPQSEIFLAPSTLSNFLALVDDPEVIRGVLYVYENIHQFAWNLRAIHMSMAAEAATSDSGAADGRKQLVKRHRSAALWFAIHRHHKMVDTFNAYRNSYYAYCRRRPKCDPGPEFLNVLKLAAKDQRDESPNGGRQIVE